ncbi:hypothetical protein FJZ31_36985 [Candidatus Poribacteria bacterium]|nr:hypothetical protein [Candidatus Poribacteria bacterium]
MKIHFVAKFTIILIFLAATILCLSEFAFAQKWEIVRRGDWETNFNDVHFVDARNGWAVGEDGVIAHTTDGGVTWTPQNSGTTNSLIGVDFVNANEGWIVGGNGTILHTINGGATWIPHAHQVKGNHVDMMLFLPLDGGG